MNGERTLRRSIGMLGAIVTIVGFVVGASIFILPGQLGAIAGPGVVFSYCLAGAVALFSCLVAAQIGCAVAANGAGFLTVARTLSPFVGFLLIWMMIGAATIAITFLGFSFADYLGVFLPAANRTIVALVVILLFGALNLMEADSVVRGQTLMVAVLMLVLVLIVAEGATEINAENLTPFFPNGLSPAVAAAVPAFFSFAGFMMIIELGGEVKNPRRNLPWALAIGFLIVLATYVTISLVVVGVTPWGELADRSAPVADLAERLFPSWIRSVVTVTALAAAASSINGMILGYSRYAEPLSRVKILPSFLLYSLGKDRGPVIGVAFLTAGGTAGVFFENTLTHLATVIAVSVMSVQIILGFALFRLQQRHQEVLIESGFYFGRTLTLFASVGLIVSSAIFLVIGLTDIADFYLPFGVYVLTGVGLYAARRLVLRNGSHSVERLVQQEFIEATSAGTHERSDYS